jgi:hypothetical protein
MLAKYFPFIGKGRPCIKECDSYRTISPGFIVTLYASPSLPYTSRGQSSSKSCATFMMQEVINGLRSAWGDKMAPLVYCLIPYMEDGSSSIPVHSSRIGRTPSQILRLRFCPPPRSDVSSTFTMYVGASQWFTYVFPRGHFSSSLRS